MTIVSLVNIETFHVEIVVESIKNGFYGHTLFVLSIFPKQQIKPLFNGHNLRNLHGVDMKYYDNSFERLTYIEIEVITSDNE